MKHFPALAALAVCSLGTSGAARAADVGVSISLSQPGVYGRVDIGRFPQPVLAAPQPVWVRRGPPVEPVYLWVPPGHRKHWARHCARYNACGAPVYFVQDGWYRQHVAPRPVYRPAPPPVYRQPPPVYERDHPGHPGWEHGREQGRGHGRGRED